MIAVYAQSSVRDGLDVALEGQEVAEDNALFVELRGRSIKLALKGRPTTTGGVRRWIGHGVVRFQVDIDDSSDMSPVVMVVAVNAFGRDAGEIADVVLNSFRCIGRTVDREFVRQLVVDAQSDLRRLSSRRKIVGAVAVAIVVGAVLVSLELAQVRSKSRLE